MMRLPMRTGALAGLLLATSVLVPGCDSGPSEKAPKAPSRSGVKLTIVSGSENKGLEPLVQQFARRQGIDVVLQYKGSVDISLALQRGRDADHDAVWPANSIWIELGDRARVVKHARSIMRSPVVFGVRCPVAERLGWKGADVTVADILAAVETGQLQFAMTSATQSNSGASFYLGALHAMAGAPDVLLAEHLADETLRDQLRRLLRSVDRSSGSSGWLKDYFVEHPLDYDAMVNYEAMLIEANRELTRRGRDPFCAVYPVDGMMLADSPLGYVDKGEPGKEEAFLALQEYLLSAKAQDEILRLGRRTGLVGVDPSRLDRSVFNPDWGIDVQRTISPIPAPRGEVLRSALELYQTALRKPSWTVYVLDYSGSMEGRPLRELKRAMRTLLEPDVASQYMLQPSAADRHVVMPFNGGLIDTWTAEGNDPDVLRGLLQEINALGPHGGTDIYAPTARAMEMFSKQGDELENYFPAIILMSDGKSQAGSLELVRSAMQGAGFERDVPTFTIAFGKADEHQLTAVSELTGGRFFNAKSDLVGAFRKAKGYN